MEVKQILKDINTILNEKMEIKLDNDINEETSFLEDGLNFNSVTILEFIIELELLYSIEVDEDELEVKHFNKAANLAEYIIGKIDK
ncbi:hypothetical protein [Abyssisolibacter fermentans]|uniref:hypothetical protein n=1 Tax=Abyssisolibacter fermentans TaxID=1766203 RepID=UPI000831B187|nr:hypothetical protein [Abyssisolibacter fermentans]